MATINNLKGTSFSSFTIGKQGVTIFQGSLDPISANITGMINGDIYIEQGSQYIWQYVSNNWTKIQLQNSKLDEISVLSISSGDLLIGSSSNTIGRLGIGTNNQVLSVSSGVLSWVNSLSNAEYISNGNTKVDTSTGTNTVQITTGGLLSASFISNIGSIAGEQIQFSNGNGQVSINSINTNSSGSVDILLNPQGSGQVKIGVGGSAQISTSSGETLLIQPGSTTSGAGAQLNITSGSTTASSQNGGDLILTGGSPGSGGSSGQVKLASGVVPTTVDSVTNKIYVDSKSLIKTTYISNTNYTATSSDYVIIVRNSNSVSTTITIPLGSSLTVGKIFIIKDGKGDALTNNVTILNTSGDLIDGQSSTSITTNYGFLSIIWDGTTWNII